MPTVAIPAVHSSSPVVASRNRTLDLLRIVFALMVLYSHAYEIPGHGNSEVSAALHPFLSLGTLGVIGFFVLSGSLIVQSWLRTPVWAEYLWKRVLRIVPGYLVAVVISVIVAGLVAPGVPHFFQRLPSARFFASIAALSGPMTPPVYPGLVTGGVNNSLWTITYEFRCYLLVGILATLGIFRYRIGWLVLSVVIFGASFSRPLIVRFSWEPHLFQGDFGLLVRLVSVFLLGGCFGIYRDRIPYNAALAFSAAAGIVAVFWLHGPEQLIYFFGAYLTFYAASLKLTFLQSARELPDISYGMYLYGWPVESLVLNFLHLPALVTFAFSSLICAALGWLSWHFVERPMLQLKIGPKAALPPG